MDIAKEKSRYWLWSVRKFGDNTSLRVPSSSFTANGIPAASDVETWEDLAFATDSSGRLGDYVWPPRSYTCSFCRREFRSAQALGGHMNVHRRDRARLKQLSSQQTYGYATAVDGGGKDSTLLGHSHNNYYQNYHRRRELQPLRHDLNPSCPTSSAMCTAVGENCCSGSDHRKGSLFVQRKRSSSLYGRVGLDLIIGENTTNNMSMGINITKKPKSGKAGEEGELDLELRLGDRPA